jgi:DHA2 family multidrug resistance protein
MGADFLYHHGGNRDADHRLARNPVRATESFHLQRHRFHLEFGRMRPGNFPGDDGPRSLQGIFGAFIGPVGQATLLDSYPRHKHPQAMAIWTMGIMVGPILGPTLGGFLTEAYSWHWVFFINVPIGIAAAIGIWLLLAKTTLPRRSFDLVGFALLGLALASLQLMLDRGPQRDWFESTEILIEAGLAVGAFWMFVVHVLTTKSPVLRLALFCDRGRLFGAYRRGDVGGRGLDGADAAGPDGA